MVQDNIQSYLSKYVDRLVRGTSSWWCRPREVDPGRVSRCHARVRTEEDIHVPLAWPKLHSTTHSNPNFHGLLLFWEFATKQGFRGWFLNFCCWQQNSSHHVTLRQIMYTERQIKWNHEIGQPRMVVSVGDTVSKQDSNIYNFLHSDTFTSSDSFFTNQLQINSNDFHTRILMIVDSPSSSVKPHVVVYYVGYLPKGYLPWILKGIHSPRLKSKSWVLLPGTPVSTHLWLLSSHRSIVSKLSFETLVLCLQDYRVPKGYRTWRDLTIMCHLLEWNHPWWNHSKPHPQVPRVKPSGASQTGYLF